MANANPQRWRPALAFLPVESVVKDNQAAYYAALRAALAQALQSTPAGSEKSSEKILDRICQLLQRDPHASTKGLAAELGISARAVEKAFGQTQGRGPIKTGRGCEGRVLGFGCAQMLSEIINPAKNNI